jgi:hypothetical protein
MNGVVAEVFDQSLPFHNQVAGPGDAIVAQLGDVTTVPLPAFAVALGGNGASAGIGLRGGMNVVVEPAEPEEEVPEPAEHAIGPPVDPSSSGPPTRSTSWLTGS